MAAEVLATAGVAVDLYDAMPSVGRKFLLAGRGGLNLTHSEPLEAFAGRFGRAAAHVRPWLEAFGPVDVRRWAEGLGIATFVGSSGRVFPIDMKAAPLLRAWLHRLRGAGVRIHARHRWVGWEAVERDTAPAPFDVADVAPELSPASDVTPASDVRIGASPRPPALRFETRAGPVRIEADAVVLGLGGGSWPRLGSDGAWAPVLAARGVDVAPLRPANCGFDVGSFSTGERTATGWSDHFRSRFAGHPLKNVALAVGEPESPVFARKGECVLTETGIEGTLVYAASAFVVERLATGRPVTVRLDLLPDRSLDTVLAELQRPRGSRSLATHLRSCLGLHGAKAGLLRECLPPGKVADVHALAQAIKALPLSLVAARPIDEAISSAGGVRFEALTEALMLRAVPGVFCAGEMLDWDAPTGGYLLTGCLASGAVAARGVLSRAGVVAPGDVAPPLQ